MVKFLLLISFSLLSAVSYGDNSQAQLSQYLFTLGKYLGYDLNGYPQGNSSPKVTASAPVSQQLLNYNATNTTQNSLVDSFLKALLVDTAGISSFIPNNSNLATINTFANFIFTNPNYSSPNTDENVSVNPLIDQDSYQMDPVSQAVLNIVATPDLSSCFDKQGKLISNCKSQTQVMINVLGNIPNPQEFFHYDYNKKVLAQLNSNSLLGPLMYSTANPSQNSTSSTPSTQTTDKGLTAQTQAEEAANFIRYAIGAVNPMSLASYKDYSTAYNNMILANSNGDNKQDSQLQAEASLVTYLTGLRVFAAQNSVGISNLYSILAKRMPQKSADNNTLTSQALAEFNMATWRLDNQNQWTKKLNEASTATVQKEMATLLAEINYQLYLSRQQQERILLTNSMLLLQNARLNQPESPKAATADNKE